MDGVLFETVPDGYGRTRTFYSDIRVVSDGSTLDINQNGKNIL